MNDLDPLLTEMRHGVLANSPQRVDVVCDAIRAAFAREFQRGAESRDDGSVPEWIASDRLFKQRLGGIMEMVRKCDEVLDADGLCECARFIGYTLRQASECGTAFRRLLEDTCAENERLKSDSRRVEVREPDGTVLYVKRCGWCGAAEGTVDPEEPCAKENGEYIGPHQFGIYERIGTPAPDTTQQDADA